MILNITGTASPFDIQRLRLRPFETYSIRLISLHAIISSHVAAGIYKICSNMIDRENGNSDRVLGYVRLDRKQYTIDFTPTQIVWYKLRLHDTQMADINLHSIDKDEKLIFSSFACQFEIISDEWVQCINSKS